MGEWKHKWELDPKLLRTETSRRYFMFACVCVRIIDSFVFLYLVNDFCEFGRAIGIGNLAIDNEKLFQNKAIACLHACLLVCVLVCVLACVCLLACVIAFLSELLACLLDRSLARFTG